MPGLFAEGFEIPVTTSTIDQVDWSATPSAIGVVPSVDTNAPFWVGAPAASYAVRYRGVINTPAAGTWTFFTRSDDGSVLWINGRKVVDNDAVHDDLTKSGTIDLPAGAAFFDLKFFYVAGGPTLRAFWRGPTVPTNTAIPGTVFTCRPFRSVPPVVGTTSLSLAGATLDGYQSRFGPYGGSNITSDFSVQTNATSAGALNVTVGSLAGNAVCGVGGTPSTVITTGSGGSISGTRTAADSRVGFSYHVAPIGTASSGALAVTGTTIIVANARYSSITLNTANAKLIISGHRVVQVDGAVTIGNNCTIEMEPDSSLRLYITAGNLAMSGTCQVNANTADPRRLQVFFTSAARTVSMSGSANFHGYVFNPGGGLAMTGGSTPPPAFFGVYHGTTISTTSTAIFHADASFAATTASTNALGGWRQTQ